MIGPKIILLCICLCLGKGIIAQTADPSNTPRPTMQCDNLQIIDKTKEMVNKMQKDGFEIMYGGFFNLDNNEFLPIWINLDKKKVYHIIVVGQPDLKYLEVGLGHPAFGTDEVQDRIRDWRDHTYFTEFTYIPPFDGEFLLSIMSRVRGKKKFSTAIYILESNKEFGGRH
jgi:hypothetical protein